MKKLHKIVFDRYHMNEYIRGRVSGIMWSLSGMPDNGYPWVKPGKSISWEICVECTVEEFDNIVNAINKLYAGYILDTYSEV